jgi:hypothetical protein
MNSEADPGQVLAPADLVGVMESVAQSLRRLEERVCEIQDIVAAPETDSMRARLEERVRELEDFVAFSASTFASNPAFVKMANELLAGANSQWLE